MALESTARGRNSFSSQQFAESAAGVHWINFGKREEVHLSSVASWPSETKNYPANDDFLAMLVRLGNRKDSLLMRVDMKGVHDTTYVFGKTLLRIRVQTLNPSRNRSRWLEP